MLAGDLKPWELTFRIHQRYGHELSLTERLAELDDEYGILEYGDRTVDQVDAEVTAEARRLAGAVARATGHGGNHRTRVLLTRAKNATAPHLPDRRR
ncbi:hypothetical protein [Streptomyces rubiginosohelvolus]|uniref:hypothetical protein n=1 Tax=Streptomyces rubiginosohelvolus TaxID=67362 RepID=UPI003682DFE8